MKPFPTRLPSLTALRAFEASARHGSFTRAAEELSMTQAAVSYQVKRLEDELAQPLFHRNGRHINLSEAGQRLALTSCEAFELIRATVAGLTLDNESKISISALPTVASYWLLPLLSRFRALRPEMAVRLDTSVTVGDVVGDFDLAIRSGTGVWPGCRAHLLFQSDFALVCAPSLVASGALSHVNHVLEVPRFGRESWWDRWLVAAGVQQVAGRSPISDLGTQGNEITAAIDQNGVALITPRFFAGEIACGQLVMPFQLRIEEERGYWLVYRKGAIPRKTRCFRDWVLAEAASTIDQPLD